MWLGVMAGVGSYAEEESQGPVWGPPASLVRAKPHMEEWDSTGLGENSCWEAVH